ncbi:MAG: hypothetical protein S4CHLAM27_09910 [Chlamydiia bacterium]|nr:hypothetical protein [Chlamydiia bacterium]
MTVSLNSYSTGIKSSGNSIPGVLGIYHLPEQIKKISQIPTLLWNSGSAKEKEKGVAKLEVLKAPCELSITLSTIFSSYTTIKELIQSGTSAISDFFNSTTPVTDPNASSELASVCSLIESHLLNSTSMESQIEFNSSAMNMIDLGSIDSSSLTISASVPILAAIATFAFIRLETARTALLRDQIETFKKEIEIKEVLTLTQTPNKSRKSKALALHHLLSTLYKRNRKKDLTSMISTEGASLLSSHRCKELATISTKDLEKKSSKQLKNYLKKAKRLVSAINTKLDRVHNVHKISMIKLGLDTLQNAASMNLLPYEGIAQKCILLFNEYVTPLVYQSITTSYIQDKKDSYFGKLKTFGRKALSSIRSHSPFRRL